MITRNQLCKCPGAESYSKYKVLKIERSLASSWDRQRALFGSGMSGRKGVSSTLSIWVVVGVLGGRWNFLASFVLVLPHTNLLMILSVFNCMAPLIPFLLLSPP